MIERTQLPLALRQSKSPIFTDRFTLCSVEIAGSYVSFQVCKDRCQARSPIMTMTETTGGSCPSASIIRDRRLPLSAGQRRPRQISTSVSGEDFSDHDFKVREVQQSSVMVLHRVGSPIHKIQNLLQVDCFRSTSSPFSHDALVRAVCSRAGDCGPFPCENTCRVGQVTQTHCDQSRRCGRWNVSGIGNRRTVRFFIRQSERSELVILHYLKFIIVRISVNITGDHHKHDNMIN